MTVTREEALAAAARIGYPVVVKPRGMGASIGVVKAHDEAAVEAAFTVADSSSYAGAPSYRGGALIEEFLEGPEISVDGAIFEGEYSPFFLAHKQVGLVPYFEELGHIVTACDPLLEHNELLDVLRAAHRAIGVTFGITHTEVKLTHRGPVIVEVNGRLGGDLIPYVGWLATGIDPATVAVDVATGMRPTFEPTRRRCVGVRFLYPPTDCIVKSVSVPPPDSELGLIEAKAIVDPHAELRLPPNGYISRYAYVICDADNGTTCDARLTAAASRVHLEWKSLSA
jgi:biotin carboxylase